MTITEIEQKLKLIQEQREEVTKNYNNFTRTHKIVLSDDPFSILIPQLALLTVGILLSKQLLSECHIEPSKNTVSSLFYGNFPKEGYFHLVSKINKEETNCIQKSKAILNYLDQYTGLLSGSDFYQINSDEMHFYKNIKQFNYSINQLFKCEEIIEKIENKIKSLTTQRDDLDMQFKMLNQSSYNNPLNRLTLMFNTVFSQKNDNHNNKNRQISNEGSLIARKRQEIREDISEYQARRLSLEKLQEETIWKLAKYHSNINKLLCSFDKTTWKIKLEAINPDWLDYYIYRPIQFNPPPELKRSHTA